MIFKFYEKNLLICLLGFSFFSCDRMKSASVVDTGVEISNPSQGTPFLQKGSSVNQEQNAVSMNGADTSPDKSVVSDLNLQTEGLTESDSVTSSKEMAKDVPDKGTPSAPSKPLMIAQKGDTAVSGDSIKKVVDTPKIEPEIINKTSNFPQNSSWRIKWEQINSFDFIQTGVSDFFYYYLQYWFNNIKDLVPQIRIPRLQESWGQFCYESNCLKGIDFKKMNQLKMRSVIKHLSFINMNVVYDNADKNAENVFFLQGQLAPMGWDRWLYIKGRKTESETLPLHIRELNRHLKSAKQKGVQKIAVNLPFQFHRDIVPFLLLGNFIKRNNIDLHIVGSCGNYCATYLLPAAKTVYIEPYGYIYYTANFLSLATEVQKVFNIQREKYIKQFKIERLPDLTPEDRVQFVLESMGPSVNPPEQLKESILFLQGKNQVTVLKQEEEFNEKLKDFRRRSGKISVADWTVPEWAEFIQSFSSELLEEMVLVFKFHTDETTKKGLSYLEQLKFFREMEGDYYSRIHIRDLEAKAAKRNYNYGGLITIFSYLLKDPEYGKFFSVPRLFYNTSEKDKPYEWVVPSVELLRRVGIDIRGENNIEMLDFSEFLLISGENKNIKEKILFLDSVAMENCNFSLSSSYTTDTLKECLAESVPKEAHSLFQNPLFSFSGDMPIGETAVADSLIEKDTGKKADTDSLVTAGEDSSSDAEAVTLGSLDFPLDRQWNFTLEQIANLNFIKKGGSSLFHYYLQLLFQDLLNNILEQMEASSTLRKLLSEFCYESDCSKGVDIKQIEKLTIPSMIRYLSYTLPIKVPAGAGGINSNAQAVYFLQGQLAPRKQNMWLYYEENKNLNAPSHIISFLNGIYWIKQNKVKKIVVNLPPQFHDDPEPFILLGKLIKEVGIDLHIVGGCEHYCMTYLLPAAKTVYIEPYGYIMYHKGSNEGLFLETKAALKAQKQVYIKQLEKEWPGMTPKNKVDFVVNKIMEEPLGVNRWTIVRKLMIILEQNDPEELNEFRTKLLNVSFQLDKRSFAEFIKEDIEELIKILSSELLKTIAFILQTIPDDKLKIGYAYTKELNYFSRQEKRYYSAIDIQSLESQKNYNYDDILFISSILLKDSIYADIFSVSKHFYNNPEKDKPYNFAVPSAELLKSLGIDIRGENNEDMMKYPETLSMLGISEKNILYLNSKAIESCGFFVQKKPFTTEKLKECLPHE